MVFHAAACYDDNTMAFQRSNCDDDFDFSDVQLSRKADLSIILVSWFSMLRAQCAEEIDF